MTDFGKGLMTEFEIMNAQVIDLNNEKNVYNEIIPKGKKYKKWLDTWFYLDKEWFVYNL